MPNENTNPKYDSGHVIVPVLHPDSWEIHNIAVPEDTSLSELHSALSDAGYEHPSLNAALPSDQPTAEGSMEHSKEFRQAASKIWDDVNHGVEKGEAAVMMRPSGPDYVGKQWTETAAGGRSMHLDVPSDTQALIHTHPNLGLPTLSPRDTATMNNLRTPVFAVSKDGLWTVDKDNKPYRVFSGTDWMNQDAQADARNNKAIESGNYVVKVQLKGGKEIVLDSGGKDYPLDMLKQLKAKGGEGFTAKDIKNVVALSHDEIKPKKTQ
jgi:hypothetical protein